jgi:hypothetical protein
MAMAAHKFLVLGVNDKSIEIPNWLIDKARYLGISVVPGMDKYSIIWEIQKREGYNPCYGQVKPEKGCPYVNCCFREFCLGLRK